MHVSTRPANTATLSGSTILANTLAMSSAQGMPAQVIAGFVDGSVNRLLGLDTLREASLALVPLGYAVGAEAGLAPYIGPLSLNKHRSYFRRRSGVRRHRRNA